MSAIFFADEEQEKEAVASKEEREKSVKCFTQVLPFKAWTNAEDYHQKYYLRKNKKILQLLNFKTDEELRESYFACRLNGYVRKGDIKDLEKEMKKWGLPKETKEDILEEVKRYRR